jgi:hypothetical protein
MEDFASIKNFSLSWRWTDSKYSQFSEDELKKIRPLKTIIAMQYYKEGISLLNKDAFTPSKDKFHKIENIQATQFKEVQNWLRSKITVNEIILSWDSNTAISVNTDLFIEKWDDFCYPSSDDIVISLKTKNSIILYQHSEIFWYAQK